MERSIYSQWLEFVSSQSPLCAVKVPAEDARDINVAHPPRDLRDEIKTNRQD